MGARWYRVPVEEASRSVYLCDRCFQPREGRTVRIEAPPRNVAAEGDDYGLTGRRKIVGSIPYGFGYGNRPGRGSFWSDGYGLESPYPLYPPYTPIPPILARRQTSFGIPGSSSSAERKWLRGYQGWILPEGFVMDARSGEPVGRPRSERVDSPEVTRAALEAALDPLSIAEARQIPRRGNLSKHNRDRLRHVNGAIACVAKEHRREVIAEILGMSRTTVYNIAKKS